MELTKLEKEILQQIDEWQEYDLTEDANDLTRSYDQWLDELFQVLPEDLQRKFFHHLDQTLLYLQLAIQQPQNFDSGLERIINEARMFASEINEIPDLQKLSLEQLTYLADKQISAHQLYSLFQGGMSGSGSSLFLGIDFPLLVTINLRAVQYIAASFGYHPKNPFELMIALKVFHCATLPKRFQKTGWNHLLEEIGNKEKTYFYEGEEQVIDFKWVNQLLLQILKYCVILLFKKNKDQSLPLLSMAIGAGVNYSMTKNVTGFAKYFYQYRCILEKTP